MKRWSTANSDQGNHGETLIDSDSIDGANEPLSDVDFQNDNDDGDVNDHDNVQNNDTQ